MGVASMHAIQKRHDAMHNIPGRRHAAARCQHDTSRILGYGSAPISWQEAIAAEKEEW